MGGWVGGRASFGITRPKHACLQHPTRALNENMTQWHIQPSGSYEIIWGLSSSEHSQQNSVDVFVLSLGFGETSCHIVIEICRGSFSRCGAAPRISPKKSQPTKSHLPHRETNITDGLHTSLIPSQ